MLIFYVVACVVLSENMNSAELIFNFRLESHWLTPNIQILSVVVSMFLIHIINQPPIRRLNQDMRDDP